MQIAFDAKRAVQNRTGLGNYSRYIIDILCRYFPDNNYFLYAPRKRENKQLETILSQNTERLHMIYPSGFWRKMPSLWRTYGLTCDLSKNHELSIFHGLSNELPLNIHRATGVKSVVTLHDLIFCRMPECYHAVDRAIYNYKYRKSCEVADLVIAVSECTKRDAMELWGIPEHKIKVIYQGCDTQFSHVSDDLTRKSVRDRYHLPSRYILNVGSIERRKNALELVEALPLILADIDLVLVGKRTSYTEEIEAYIREKKLENRVHLLSNVTFPDLPAVYQMADVFAYPSRYEGFGIPLLEALISGVPVVAAKGSCLEEAGGPDSMYVSPDDERGLSEAVNSILSNSDLRRQMIENGRHYALRFSEEVQARQLMKAYESLLE